MKRLLTTSILAALAISQANATVIFSDSFEGTAGTALDGYTLTGNGSGDGRWEYVSPGLSFGPNYQNTSGLAAQTTVHRLEATRALSSSIPLTDNANTGTFTLYASALFNLPSAGSWGSPLSGVHMPNNPSELAREGLSFGIYKSADTTTEVFGVNLGARASNNIGSTNQNDDQAVFSTGVNVNPGSTYLMLVKYEIDLDSSAMGSMSASYKIYEDGVDSFDGSEPGTWDGSFQTTKAWPITQNGSTIDDITLYRDNVSYGPIIDEVRLGTEFSSVAVPEPTTYAAIAGALVLGLAIWRRRR